MTLPRADHSGGYMRPRQPGLTVPACLTAFADRHRTLDADGALTGLDARDIAARIEGAAKAGQLEGLAATFETIGALALAGLIAASRADELRIDAGDAAA